MGVSTLRRWVKEFEESGPAGLAAEHGDGAVPVPKPTRARALLREIQQGHVRVRRDEGHGKIYLPEHRATCDDRGPIAVPGSPPPQAATRPDAASPPPSRSTRRRGQRAG